MPVIPVSTFQPNKLIRNPHVQTIIPNRFRRVRGPELFRERIETGDGDFLDIDWAWAVPGSDPERDVHPIVPADRRSGRLAIVTHGLEGDSRRPYNLSMVAALTENGWDACAWNFRGCSGEMNRLAQTYHAGFTIDLDTVIRHAVTKHKYKTVVLVGFSLGGNLTLKYLGERKGRVHKTVKAAVTFSVPVDLKGAAFEVQRGMGFYDKMFVKSLVEKMKYKMDNHPDDTPAIEPEMIRTVADFDEHFQAPLNGYTGAEEYWAKNNSLQFLSSIKVPTLVVNAWDDPMLPETCYPFDVAAESKYVFLEVPRFGGHTGFWQWGRRHLWSELRTIQFLAEQLYLPK